MFGIGKLIGEFVGTTVGIAIAPLALALGVTEEIIKEAIDAGCKTVDEIKEFVEVKKK